MYTYVNTHTVVQLRFVHFTESYNPVKHFLNRKTIETDLEKIQVLDLLYVYSIIIYLRN